MTMIKSISGIRGTIGGKQGESLTPVDVVKFTAAYASWMIEETGIYKVVIGRDARLSGEMVRQLVTGTLQGMGITVVDLGLSTTPTVEMAVVAEEAGGGIILTASHNPKEWNALKLLNQRGEFISAEAGNKVLELAEDTDLEFAGVDKLGAYVLNTSYLDWHIERILELELVDVDKVKAAGFKIVVDGVNSSGGIAVPKLLEAMGVEVIKLYCEPDGKFPHNPEPLAEHLTALSSEVKTANANLGISVDPDVDRLAFVSEDGEMFGEEYTLVAIADHVLKNKKGATVSNLSSTRALRDVTEKHGCEYYPSAVGEVNVVVKMKEVDAVIGGEGNGGVIYPELHYGRDALVGIALFLTHLAEFGKSISMLRATYPNYIIVKKKMQLTPEVDLENIFAKIEEKYSREEINKVDGLKIEFESDWVHLRRSNTEPIIRIYAESQSETAANSIAEKLISDIKEVMAEKVEE